MWKRPESDEAWEEKLSAYLDDEMSEEERVEVERCLEEEPLRGEQLAALRETSGMLREWQVEPPRPDAEFVHQFRDVAANGRSRSWRGLSWLRPVFPAFAAGLAVGVMGMAALRGENAPAPRESAPPVGIVEPRPVNATISPAQADGLLIEMEAEGLKASVLEEIGKYNAAQALKAFEELEQNYPQSIALRDLTEDRRFRRLSERMQLASIGERTERTER